MQTAKVLINKTVLLCLASIFVDMINSFLYLCMNFKPLADQKPGSRFSCNMVHLSFMLLFQLNGNPMTAKEEKIQMLTERINDLVQQVSQSMLRL